MLRLAQKIPVRRMSLWPFDDFFRPTHVRRRNPHLLEVHYPSPGHHHWPGYPHWPPLGLSQAEAEFDDFIKSVDHRFSGILSNVHRGPHSVDIDHEDGAGEASGDKPKKFEMKLAVQDFRPEDIKVKVQGDNLVVEAKREEKKEQDGMYAHSYREFKRSFALPEGVDKKQLSSSLSSGGILEIEAPIVAAIEQKPEEKKKIEVTHMEEE